MPDVAFCRITPLEEYIIILGEEANALSAIQSFHNPATVVGFRYLITVNNNERALVQELQQLTSDEGISYINHI
jgi:hypothetical protein